MLVKVTTSLNSIVHSLNSPVGRKTRVSARYGWTITTPVGDLMARMAFSPFLEVICPIVVILQYDMIGHMSDVDIRAYKM